MSGEESAILLFLALVNCAHLSRLSRDQSVRSPLIKIGYSISIVIGLFAVVCYAIGPPIECI